MNILKFCNSILLLIFAIHTTLGQPIINNENKSIYKIEFLRTIDISDLYCHPKISPNGDKISLQNLKTGYLELYDLGNNKLNVVSSSKIYSESVIWNDNNSIKYQIKNSGNFEEYKIDENETKKNVSNQQQIHNDKIAISLRYDLKLKKVISLVDGIQYEVTKKPGIYYKFLLSPDHKKLIIHENDGCFYLYSVKGEGVPIKIDRGICENWSSDSDFLFYFKDKDNGEKVIESDIFVADLKSNKQFNLTNTQDKIETWPSISYNSEQIVYLEEVSHKIIICNLIIQK
jgi:Tol biopolymer transport system component